MIKRIIGFVRRKKDMAEQFLANSDKLVPGEYIFDTWLTYIHIKDDSISKRAEFMFAKRPKKTSHLIAIFIIRTLFFRKKTQIRQSKQSLTFFGTVYLPANNQGENNDAKIFDFENKKVMSLLSSGIKFSEKVEDYKRFRSYFPIPAILWKDSNDLLIIEELIEFTSSSSWLKEKNVSFTNDLFERYTKYLKHCKKDNDFFMITPNELYKNLDKGNNDVKSFILKYTSEEVRNIKFPIVKLHGDLWSSNVLLRKGSTSEFYYIDWEYATDLVFFYDVFWFMQNEAIYHENLTFIKSYINGEYDSQFEEMFKAFGLEFEEEHRQEYFVIFFLNMFVSRLRNKNQNTKNGVYNQFVNLFEEMK